uniref:Uncharacterized protein n=1 Tax=Pristionchus pacificus TaxID=54126 RepID=A0A2A6CDX4_PRIPA|eukprot:PDM76316.1 hypothetical protein PRIPAC_39920 [Pristionchus pacificus]
MTLSHQYPILPYPTLTYRIPSWGSAIPRRRWPSGRAATRARSTLSPGPKEKEIKISYRIPSINKSITLPYHFVSLQDRRAQGRAATPFLE